jgi:hypothetical protein
MQGELGSGSNLVQWEHELGRYWHWNEIPKPPFALQSGAGKWSRTHRATQILLCEVLRQQCAGNQPDHADIHRVAELLVSVAVCLSFCPLIWKSLQALAFCRCQPADGCFRENCANVFIICGMSFDCL